jgi:hypothetical protein
LDTERLEALLKNMSYAPLECSSGEACPIAGSTLWGGELQPGGRAQKLALT